MTGQIVLCLLGAGLTCDSKDKLRQDASLGSLGTVRGVRRMQSFGRVANGIFKGFLRGVCAAKLLQNQLCF